MRSPLLLGSSCLIPASPLICTGGFLHKRFLRTQHFPDFPVDVFLAAQQPLLGQHSATTPAPRGQTPTWHCNPCRAPRQEEEGDAHSSSMLKRLLSTSACGQQHRREGTRMGKDRWLWSRAGVSSSATQHPYSSGYIPTWSRGSLGASPAISPAQACAVSASPCSHGNWTFSTPNSFPFGKEFTNKRHLVPNHRPDPGCLKRANFLPILPQMFPPSCK